MIVTKLRERKRVFVGNSKGLTILSIAKIKENERDRVFPGSFFTSMIEIVSVLLSIEKSVEKRI